MKSDKDNADYKAEYEVVFDDRLGFDNTTKYLIESTTLDWLPDNLTIVRTPIYHSTLTAERKTRDNGSDYILIREATSDEEIKTSRPA